MIRLFIVISILFITIPAYAVDRMATGYDYVLMNDDQKTELVNTLYTILKVDKNVKAPEGAVVALDGFYQIYSNEVENKEAAIKAVFNRPVMAILAELLTMEAPKSYDETLLKKYGLTQKK